MADSKETGPAKSSGSLAPDLGGSEGVWEVRFSFFFSISQKHMKLQGLPTPVTGQGFYGQNLPTAGSLSLAADGDSDREARAEIKDDL